MPAARKIRPKFRVGDRVRFPFDRGSLTGVIVEDCGNLGVGGRRLYLVDGYMTLDQIYRTLQPEEDLETEPEIPEPLDHARVIEYLKVGGLVSILMAEASLSRNPPRVWLCRNNLGNIDYTFLPDRGVLGGAGVPSRAMNDRWKVFASKKEKVLEMLTSFDLSREEAEEVISAFGTTTRG